MKVGITSLQVLLLLAATLAADRDVLLVDEDESLGFLNNKGDTFDSSEEKTDEPEQEQDKIPWQVAEGLVDAIKEFGSISLGPVAIYRDDLPSDYVAYWLLELNSSQYIVSSSGPETGDYLVSSQGPLPSPITQLDSTAEKYGKECVRYLMMTPGGQMMCRDKTGKIIATTAEDLLLPGDNAGDDPNIEFAHEYTEKHIKNLADQWKARAAEVARKSIWANQQVMASTESNAMSDFTENYVRPGEVTRVPVDEDTVSVKVKYQPESKKQTAEDVAQIQKAVCQMISSCDIDDECNIDLLQKKSVLHLRYIELEISKDIAAVFKDRRSVDFELRVQQASGTVIVTHYSLDTTRHRQKRFKEYKSTSSWSYRSIPDESNFPNYWQHKIASDCDVGCGPVAWSMIFGYYDRRSHYKSSTYGSGSQGLYRCGNDGTSGSSSCTAPSSSNSDTSPRLKKYIEKIAKTLGTWCIFKNGATPAYKMDNIKSFFQARQTSGSPIVQQTNNLWNLIARDSTASKARQWIRSGWPVVVGTTEGSAFAWHYPVATKYRSRTRKYRSCVKVIWKVCGSWKTMTEYQMYTHQGWQGTKTKWRAMELHYAAIANY